MSSDAPILVCDCGKRLRAPGAVPGRVGRCPSCGGTLRVSAMNVTAPRRDDDDEGRRPPDPVPPEAGPRRPRRVPKDQRSATGIWDGFVAAPVRPETAVGESLLYPLRGANGTVLLAAFPPMLWFASLPFVTAAKAWTVGESTFGIGVLFLLLPASFGLVLVGGFALLFLGRVLASSAVGDLHHPRWPDWELSSIAFGLVRWLLAAVAGLGVGGFPAVAYWVYCGDVDLFDGLVLGELMAAGAAYALMGLLASILHEDLWGANPLTVARAIRRVGWGYLQPCLLAGFVALGSVTVLVASLKVENPAASAFLFWAFWFGSLYGAMVVLRVLGLFYARHARDLGWFRGRSGWGG